MKIPERFTEYVDEDQSQSDGTATVSPESRRKHRLLKRHLQSSLNWKKPERTINIHIPFAVCVTWNTGILRMRRLRIARIAAASEKNN